MHQFYRAEFNRPPILKAIQDTEAHTILLDMLFLFGMSLQLLPFISMFEMFLVCMGRGGNSWESKQSMFFLLIKQNEHKS
jgi:hypothetical protein